MNDRIIELIKKLYKEFGSEGLHFSLTLNYERVCSDYKPKKFNANSLIKMKSLIDAVMVESFNFTIIEKSGINNSTFVYSPDWYSLDYIFYGGKEPVKLHDDMCEEGDNDNDNNIHCEFSFSSNYASLRQLPVKYKNVEGEDEDDEDEYGERLPNPEATDENIKNLKYLAFIYKKANLEISNILNKIK